MGKITTNSFANKCAAFIRRTWYSNTQSDEDIHTICQKYNIADYSQAIRCALRDYAERPIVAPTQPTARRGRPPTKAPG